MKLTDLTHVFTVVVGDREGSPCLYLQDDLVFHAGKDAFQHPYSVMLEQLVHNPRDANSSLLYHLLNVCNAAINNTHVIFQTPDGQGPVKTYYLAATNIEAHDVAHFSHGKPLGWAVSSFPNHQMLPIYPGEDGIVNTGDRGALFELGHEYASTGMLPVRHLHVDSNDFTVTTHNAWLPDFMTDCYSAYLLAKCVFIERPQVDVRFSQLEIIQSDRQVFSVTHRIHVANGSVWLLSGTNRLFTPHHQAALSSKTERRSYNRSSPTNP